MWKLLQKYFENYMIYDDYQFTMSLSSCLSFSLIWNISSLLAENEGELPLQLVI